MAKASFKVTGSAPTGRNPMASVLAHGAFHARVVKAKKGSGSYDRKFGRKEARKAKRSSYE